jgi:predicted nuclease with TOPRIM domain
MGKATPPTAEYMKTNDMIRKQHDIAEIWAPVYVANVGASVKYRDWYKRQRDRMDEPEPDNDDIEQLQEEVDRLEAELADDSESMKKFDKKLEELSILPEDKDTLGEELEAIEKVVDAITESLGLRDLQVVEWGVKEYEELSDEDLYGVQYPSTHPGAG